MGLFDDVATLVRAERRILARSRRGLGPPSRPDFQAQRAGTHPQRRWGASLRSALGAVAIAAALLLSQNPAAAQFVCQDVVTGTGQGATATAGSLACGPGALTQFGTNSAALGVATQAIGDASTSVGNNNVAGGPGKAMRSPWAR